MRFWEFGVTLANFDLFLINLWPCRPLYTSKEVKTHISTSVTIIYDLSESYMHHLSTKIPNLSYFFMENVDFQKKGPWTDRFFHF